jgi:MFS family permease
MLFTGRRRRPNDGRVGMTRSRSLALATLLFVLFLTFLDNTIVTVVLANVQGELHASVSQLQWVVNGYALGPQFRASG